MDEIHRIERISYNSGRVERITRYTPEKRAAKIKEIALAEADRAEIREYLAKFPNPEHLSFAELLEQALSNQKTNDDELAYILDIGNHQEDTSGVIVDIGIPF
jgi:hypothetical protein